MITWPAGALMMIGGYYSFRGINGGARYRHTEVEKVLPVRCLAGTIALKPRKAAMPK
ncbi:hypothetical protein KPZU09_13120 [Klebsiella pneumoniae]|uniref:Putative glutamine amidotransferase domain-containing protein n=1 Tax=Klebsiella pneumoniae TaxID=573 RepID=A0A919HMH2_KLEPN|nr:hypothetical protein KPZU09_13120 [Klebsiella pneumoniae]